MVKPSADQLEELQRLESRAEQLLDAIANSAESICDETLRDLDLIAKRAAKICYGSASPELLSQQMHDLITWTDRMDDAPWVDSFRTALRHRPLTSPVDTTI